MPFSFFHHIAGSEFFLRFFSDLFLAVEITGIAFCCAAIEHWTNWTFNSQLAKFIRRFWSNPYRKEDMVWIQKLVNKREIKVKQKIVTLRKRI